MRAKTLKSCLLLIVCLAAVVIAHGQYNRKKASGINPISVNEIRNYRKMRRVNQKPIDMVESTKMMCAPPMMMLGPHYDPGVVYYINDIARKGLRSFPETKLFPVGSIIVKEKQETKTEDSVQIITVMKKVLSGRDESSWKYAMYDAKKWTEVDFTKATTASYNKSCIECHVRYKDNDYVSDKGINLMLGENKLSLGK